MQKLVWIETLLSCDMQEMGAGSIVKTTVQATCSHVDMEEMGNNVFFFNFYVGDALLLSGIVALT